MYCVWLFRVHRLHCRLYCGCAVFISPFHTYIAYGRYNTEEEDTPEQVAKQKERDDFDSGKEKNSSISRTYNIKVGAYLSM